MKKNIIFCLFLIPSSILFAQNELAICSVQAKIALNQKDTTKALEFYDKAFRYAPNKPFDYIKAIVLWDKKGNYEQAAKLTRGLLSLGYSFESIESKVSEPCKSSEEWQKSKQLKDTISSAYQANINTALCAELDKMTYIDQEIRQAYMKSLKDSISRDKIQFSMELIDSINFVNLLKLTKAYGFPNYKTVGYKGVNDAWLLLWHHRGAEIEDNPLWLEIVPYIETEISKGTLDKDFLVMFIDHNEVENGRPMIYGSLYGYYRGQKEYDELQVVDKENLNLRRKEKGMAPIELWLESLNLPIPEQIK